MKYNYNIFILDIGENGILICFSVLFYINSSAAVLTVAAGLFVFLSSGYQSVSVGLTIAAAAIAYALVMCFPAGLTFLLGKSLGKLMLKYAE